MTKKEIAKIREAMRLFATNDGYEEAMRILRRMSGGPWETPLEKALKNAESVPINQIKGEQSFKFPEK